MNRRAFMQMLSGLAAFASMPVVLAASKGPRTVGELEAAIKGLYARAEDMKPRAFEEWVHCDFGNPYAEWPVYRMVPEVWRRRGKTEAELVEVAWADMQEAAKGYQDATLYWRKRPKLELWHDNFGDDERDLSLRFRFAILPADWIDRARTNTGREDLGSWRGKFVTEGAPTPRLA